MKKRKEWDTNNWQGKTKKQIEDTHKITGIALFGLFLTLVGMIIYGLIWS